MTKKKSEPVNLPERVRIALWVVLFPDLPERLRSLLGNHLRIGDDFPHSIFQTIAQSPAEKFPIRFSGV